MAQDKVKLDHTQELIDEEYAEMQVEEAALQPFVELQPPIRDGWLILPITNMWFGADSQIDSGYGRLKSGASSKLAQMGYVLFVAFLYVGEGEPTPIPEGTISKAQYESIFAWHIALQATMQLHYQATLLEQSNF